MPFVDILREYFRGERIESLFVMVPFGLLCMLFAFALLKEERSGFFIGVAVPFCLFGLALVVMGATVGLRTPEQMEALLALYSSDASAFVAEELPRMHKVNANWPMYLATWCALLVIGVGLRFGISKEWAHGLGIALVFFGGVGLLVDGFAERRARPYTAALEALQR